MGLQLYVSNSLEELSIKLNEAFKRRKLNVFEPDYIVTQTEGMNNWLKLQIANDPQIGIAANVRFLKPNDLIHRAYYLLGGEFTATLSSENLCWLLYKILGEEDFTRRFPVIAAYYQEDDGNKAVKRMALAEKVADLFDQYQIYRTDYIESWNQAPLKATNSEEWQKYLWVRAKALAGHQMADKTQQGRFIIEQLMQSGELDDLVTLMPEVHLFGISITTSYHLRVLEALAQHINVTFYIQNPAPTQYWLDTVSEKQLDVLVRKGLVHAGDVTIGNSLLTSWGRLIKDTFSLFFEYEEFLNAYTEVGVIEPNPDSLLHQIQYDIFHNINNDERSAISLAAIQDGSITINSCYTIAREVEVLYNYLVHLVDQKKEFLSPQDIVVMVSDIDAYAPYIKAVFQNAPYTFNFTIADEIFASSDTITNALKAVLEIGEDSFKAENVVQLLDFAFVRKRFGLTNASLVRKMVDRANIRFGIEGNKEDDTVYVSWKYGMQRLVYGICMSGEDEYAFGDDTLFPLDVLEGSESGELIRFCHFVQVLIDTIDQRRDSRTITDWVLYTKSVLANLVYEVGDVVEEEYSILLKQLDNYNEHDKVIDERLPYDVFCHNFLQSISSVTRSTSFANGGITFCSLIPMRSIPFRVVALLGLNFDKFPRKETIASFNLMDKEKRKGDRNVKDNDKHLFLETLLSAQQYLYISYLGQSVRDNTVMPPSALVDELLDYIETRYEGKEDVRKMLITQHPLHSFSRRYGLGDKRLYNYIIDHPGEHTSFFNYEKERELFKTDEISLGEFISFFKNPFKAYYNKVLGIRYEEESTLLGDTELFTLDSLQQWSLKHELLVLKEEEWAVFKNKQVKTGGLPLKNMAEIAMRNTRELVNPVRKLILNTVGEATSSSIPIELQLGNTILRGLIHCVYDHRLVFVSFSKGECKYLIEAYLQYLVGRAAGVLEELHFISAHKEEVYIAQPISQQDAQQRLEALVDRYMKGHHQVAAFYPDFKIEPAAVADLDMTGFLKVVDDKLDNYMYPCTDPYIMRVYEKGFFRDESVLNDYKANCALLLTPLTQLFPAYYQ